MNDSKAESLEAKGLYRRAASRWAEVMTLCTDEEEREYARRRRQKCLKLVKRPAVAVDNFGDVRKAVKDTHDRMGLSTAPGEAIRDALNLEYNKMCMQPMEKNK
ncbi:PerC family transcriptional regulator [Klebsiella pneumoniae]|nr:PerC family transcriptional regulator [Klebsiella pneumoniae]